ncbi:hypothetical protein F8568_025025 [Actinomadura sp. LD22]|uniref:FAD-binding domain-containing protein n=2 Tax=Actinomadura physcomitrii TaxID=2650748 RepID=A0A6I4MHU4_9ACTN|nr:hypothetical protein [Actinomadura physcomitrii]
MTFPVTITSARPVDPWDDPVVTLLGDAVHTMSPGRGDGAGIALRDAHLLGDLLTSDLTVAEAKTAYEHQMLDYGFAAVEASRNRPFGFFGKSARPGSPDGRARRRPDDRRSVVVTLTDEGRMLLPKIPPVFGQTAALLTAGISPDELQTTHRALLRMRENLASGRR